MKTSRKRFCVVLWEFWLKLNEIHEVRTFAPFKPLYLFLLLLLLLLLLFRHLKLLWIQKNQVRVKTDHSVSLRWNMTFRNIFKEVCILLIIVHSICELILCPVLCFLSPGWIKTRLYSVISFYVYFFYMRRLIYLVCREPALSLSSVK